MLRAIELSAVSYCPAQAMFNQIIPIDIKYHIYEVGDGGGEPALVTSGVYSLPETA